MELISSILAISALVVSKIVNDQHADDKSVDELEERLASEHPHQPDTDAPS